MMAHSRAETPKGFILSSSFNVARYSSSVSSEKLLLPNLARIISISFRSLGSEQKTPAASPPILQLEYW